MANEQEEFSTTGDPLGKEIEVTCAGRSIKLTLTGDHGGDGYFVGVVANAFEAMTNVSLSGVDTKTYDNECMQVNARGCKCVANGTFATDAVFAFAPKLRKAVDALAERQQEQNPARGA